MAHLRRIAILCLVFCAAGGLARAGWFELSFNDRSFDLSSGAHLGSDGTVALGGRYVYDDDNDGNLGAFLLGFETRPEALPGFELTLGGAAFLGKAGSADIGALAVGISVLWTPEELKGVYFAARYLRAPAVFSWSDADGMNDWAIRAGFRFTPTVAAFVQYQNVEVERTSGGTVDVQAGALFGFSARF